MSIYNNGSQENILKTSPIKDKAFGSRHVKFPRISMPICDFRNNCRNRLFSSMDERNCETA